MSYKYYFLILQKILLLEAGDEEPIIANVPGLSPILLKSSIDYNYVTQPEPIACKRNLDHACTWPRGKVMGGTSTINSMLYVKGNKNDYNNWARLGNTEWSWRKIQPYFQKSLDSRIPKVCRIIYCNKF